MMVKTNLGVVLYSDDTTKDVDVGQLAKCMA